EQRQRLDRPDERAPFEEEPIDPKQAGEVRGVEGPQPAPQHEVLRFRHGRDRIHLQEPEPSHGAEHAVGGPIEQLRANRDPSRLLQRDRSSQRAAQAARNASAVRAALSAASCRYTKNWNGKPGSMSGSPPPSEAARNPMSGT